jgi:hypothetical protein
MRSIVKNIEYYAPAKRKKRLELDELALKYDTDKSSEGHGYTRYIYPLYLDGLRYAAVSFLEIGIREGNSLKMWDEYFTNKNSRLFAVDIIKVENTPKRFTCFKANQKNLQDIAKKIGDLDLVVDDGEHSYEAGKLAFECLWPYLNAGGLYIIEDVKDSPDLLDYFNLKVKNSLMSSRASDYSFIHFYSNCILIKKY